MQAQITFGNAAPVARGLPLLTLTLTAALAGALAPAAAAQAQAPTERELANGWVEVAPGAATMCSRGDPWTFFVRPGTGPGLVIDFLGGGACWDAASCAPGSNWFLDDLAGLDTAVSREYGGIVSDDPAENPVADWTIIVVPYCTADDHWGDGDATYGAGTDAEVTIHHRGATNVRAALAWVADHVSGPPEVLVAGCSAGVYGAMVWFPRVAAMFPEAQLVLYADSGSPVASPAFFAYMHATWQYGEPFPPDLPELGEALTAVERHDLSTAWILLCNRYPSARFGMFNWAFDRTQSTYATPAGGPAFWNGELRASLATITARTHNFYTFLAFGARHCVDHASSFYTVTSSDVALSDWFRALVTGDGLRSVDCDECGGAVLAQSGTDDCLATPEGVGGLWLSDVAAFPEHERAAAAVVAEALGEAAGDFMATVEPEGEGLVFHLWHRSAFLPENCNLTGNPGGRCRDVHVSPTSDGSWEITATLFWQ